MTDRVAANRLSHRLYRQEALERLMAAEQWDQLLSLARPKGWVTGLGLALLVVAAGLWGIWGSVTETASAQGTVVRTTISGAPLDLVLRLPASQAAGIHSGMTARVVPLSDGSTASLWRGFIRSVSVETSGRATRARDEGQTRFGGDVRLRLRLGASTIHETMRLARHTQCAVTIITGKRSPLRAIFP